ncbi:hypothetical protein Tco_0911052 [Tanacetum coccineum]|uniref:Uncharacterized protein n=1 Tax=Tanacetum coccineum TaxID=301880 RepID=A0ABQ5CW45_9ASTR
MHINKSFNRNPANHQLYHVLIEALIEDENAIDKGVADIVKDHKRKHDDDEDDDDEDPPARPNQDKKTNRRRTKDFKSSKKPSSTKETSKGKAPTKGSKTGKSPSHRTVAADYFFNNDLEYLKTSYPEVKYTSSITKTKAAQYEIKGIEDMVPTLWSTIKHAYDKDAEKGIKHWGERHKLCYRSQSVSVKKLHGYVYLEKIMVKRTNQQLYKFKECDFVDLHLNDIKDMLLYAVQHNLFHLDESVIVDFIVALQIEFKEPYTPSYDLPGIVYEDLNKQKRFLRADELYKFSDGTLKSVCDEIYHRVLYFHLDYNTEMPTRKWTFVDRKRSGLMIELIDKQLREREIIRSLERLVGARELEMDYKLMTGIV